MARTTLDIASPILAELRELQRREGRTLGSLATELLADALVARRQRDTAPPGLAWTARAMGVPRVDIDDKDALHAFLEARGDGTGGIEGADTGAPPARTDDA